MQEIISAIKSHVERACSNTNFVHHKWYYQYHLLVVERIALELCTIYPSSDRDIVELLVWIHDYEKITRWQTKGEEDKHQEGLVRLRLLLSNCGMTDSDIEDMIKLFETFETKANEVLKDASIEIQIVSSADAASHLASPFFPIDWYEYHNLSIDELLQRGKDKLKKDWEQKITLPEVKKKFRVRYELLLEITAGQYPDSYFS